MIPKLVTIAVEGPSDVPVVAKILAGAGLTINVIHGRGGKGVIDSSLNGYNRAAAYSPWLVLRDLDSDASCAAELRLSLLGTESKWMRFRIPVRAMEAWLLADTEQISRFLRVKSSLVPPDPDGLSDPKGALVNLARKSPIAALREDMVPAEGMTGRVGRGYVSRVSGFATDRWRPDVAMTRSDSLKRCIRRVQELAKWF